MPGPSSTRPQAVGVGGPGKRPRLDAACVPGHDPLAAAGNVADKQAERKRRGGLRHADRARESPASGRPALRPLSGRSAWWIPARRFQVGLGRDPISRKD